MARISQPEFNVFKFEAYFVSWGRALLHITMATELAVRRINSIVIDKNKRLVVGIFFIVYIKIWNISRARTNVAEEEKGAWPAPAFRILNILVHSGPNFSESKWRIIHG